jgi:hypothetical protein
MSIDFLYDLERDIDNGREIYGCPGSGVKQWIFSRKGPELLKKLAQRAANSTKMAVNIVRLVSRHSLSTNMLLVPVAIGEAGPRGEPQIKWSVVESKEAAEMLRDIRLGPSPYFALEVEEVIEPIL